MIKKIIFLSLLLPIKAFSMETAISVNIPKNSVFSRALTFQSTGDIAKATELFRQITKYTSKTPEIIEQKNYAENYLENISNKPLVEQKRIALQHLSHLKPSQPVAQLPKEKAFSEYSKGVAAINEKNTPLAIAHFKNCLQESSLGNEHIEFITKFLVASLKKLPALSAEDQALIFDIEASCRRVKTPLQILPVQLMLHSSFKPLVTKNAIEFLAAYIHNLTTLSAENFTLVYNLCQASKRTDAQASVVAVAKKALMASACSKYLKNYIIKFLEDYIANLPKQLNEADRDLVYKVACACRDEGLINAAESYLNQAADAGHPEALEMRAQRYLKHDLYNKAKIDLTKAAYPDFGVSNGSALYALGVIAQRAEGDNKKLNNYKKAAGACGFIPPAPTITCDNGKDALRYDEEIVTLEFNENDKKFLKGVEKIGFTLTEKERPKFPCSFEGCSEWFYSQDSCDKHLKEEHHSFNCNEYGCNKKFETKKGLAVHKRVHTKK